MITPKKEPDRMAFLSKGTGNRERSQAQERRIAKKTGGVVQRASGATAHRKGDVDRVPSMESSGRFKIEAKTTKCNSYKLNYADLKKIEEEAFRIGMLGAMVVTFEDRHDYIVVRREFVDFGG